MEAKESTRFPRIIRRNPFGAVAESSLAQFESEIGFPLPGDYRSFLAWSNGGQSPDEYEVPGEGRTPLRGFYGLHAGPLIERLRYMTSHPQFSLPRGVLLIGDDSADQLFAMRVTKRPGEILRFDPRGFFARFRPKVLAASFDEFARSLQPPRARGLPVESVPDPFPRAEYRPLLERDDLQGLKAALNRIDAQPESTLIDGLLLDASGIGALECARWLLDRGANPKGCLRFAVYSQVLDLVLALIEHGADLAETSRSGATPLENAIRVNHPEIAIALVRAGADPNRTDGDGKTLSDLARRASPETYRALMAIGAWKSHR